MYREAKQYEQGKTTPSAKENLSARTKRPGSELLKKDSSVSKPQVTASSSKNVTKTQDKVESSAAKVEKGKDEDDASETGTYTIEGEKDSKEEDKAREDIDKVFGLQNGAEKILADKVETDRSEMCDVDTVQNKEEITVSKEEVTLNKEEMTVNKEELTLEDIEDQISDLERKRSEMPEACSMDVDIGSAVNEELKIIEDQVGIHKVLSWMWVMVNGLNMGNTMNSLSCKCETEKKNCSIILVIL